MTLPSPSPALPALTWGREICGNLALAEPREWLVTNGTGSYGCGTVAGLLTRHYHGLLVAALQPPVDRALLVTKINETVTLGVGSIAPLDSQAQGRPPGGSVYELGCDRWQDDTIQPQGYRHIESFGLEGHVPCWRFACGDALLEKRIWMEQGANTTYVQYHLRRSSQPLQLRARVWVNYRSHHNSTILGDDWIMDLQPVPQGIRVLAYGEAVPFWIWSEGGGVTLHHTWYRGYSLAIERYRGISPTDDHLHAVTFEQILQPGDHWTIVASTDPQADRRGDLALERRHRYEQNLLETWQGVAPGSNPPWIAQLVLAADQFIVDRRIDEQVLDDRQPLEPSLTSPSPLENPMGQEMKPAIDPTIDPAIGNPISQNMSQDISQPMGKTVIAGYPWFGDWGRDTLISLPGLTLVTGRSSVAQLILRTFGRHINQGMIPNMFPEAGVTPTYNTVDATLWYFEALWSYYRATGDRDLVAELFPALDSVIQWHQRGTRYGIHVAEDGLVAAGEEGVQLTWMDAKVGNWVVTPRRGKPVEISALWYNALGIMGALAEVLSINPEPYGQAAALTRRGFARFWNPDRGYCYDVLDGPQGAAAHLRPNQLFAVALAPPALPPLLTPVQARAVVDACAQHLVTSHGLRSLAPFEADYQGHYGGDPRQRDGAYHQGTVWGWLLGSFVQAHYRVYGDLALARSFLEPMAQQLEANAIGTLAEIFDGDAPMDPRGAFAQAWTVAEVLRTWAFLQDP